MAAQYTILRSNGQVLTTIQDGTINTTSTSLSLFGRNSSQYGAALDTNFVQMLENFSSPTPPANPIKGQLWFNSAQNTLNVCPADNTTTAVAWITLTSTNSGGTATLGNLVVTGNVTSGNASLGNIATANNFTAGNVTITANATAANASFTNANISTLRTQIVTTGGTSVTGTLTGLWSAVGTSSGNALTIQTGNLAVNNTGNVYGILCDKYMYANGQPFNPSGTYNDANVYTFLTGSSPGGAPSNPFNGALTPSSLTTSNISAGLTAAATGNITGTWTLTAGSTIQATYADLAERFESDMTYDEGTVVELGGDKEVTAVVDELSDRVFGVVSMKAAYVMNSQHGYTNETHPAIALSGRVPVKVIGQIRKGDRLVSAGKGKARSAAKNEANAFNTIGRALTDKDTSDEGIITAFVTVK